MSRKSWNPLEILADVIEGEIFEGEPAAPKVNANELTSTQGPATGKQEQAEGTRTRKPAAASLADAFTDASASVEPVAVAAPITAAAPAAASAPDDADS